MPRSFHKALFQLVGLQHVLGHRFILPWAQNSALHFAELHKALVCPFPQPVPAPSKSSTAISAACSSPCAIYQLAQGTCCPVILSIIKVLISNHSKHTLQSLSITEQRAQNRGNRWQGGEGRQTRFKVNDFLVFNLNVQGSSSFAVQESHMLPSKTWTWLRSLQPPRQQQLTPHSISARSLSTVLHHQWQLWHPPFIPTHSGVLCSQGRFETPHHSFQSLTPKCQSFCKISGENSSEQPILGFPAKGSVSN